MSGTLKQIEARLRAKMDAKEWSMDLPGDEPQKKRPQTHTVKTRGATPPVPVRKMPQLVFSKPKEPKPPASFDIEGEDAPEAPETISAPVAPPPKKPQRRVAVPAPPGSKTVGVEVPPHIYEELVTLKKERGLGSIKEALLLAARHGLPNLKAWHRR